jgi:ribosomal protein S4E
MLCSECKRKRAAAPNDKRLDQSSYWWMVARQPAPHFSLPGDIVCQFVPLLNIAKFNQS